MLQFLQAAVTICIKMNNYLKILKRIDKTFDKIVKSIYPCKNSNSTWRNYEKDHNTLIINGADPAFRMQ